MRVTEGCVGDFNGFLSQTVQLPAGACVLGVKRGEAVLIYNGRLECFLDGRSSRLVDRLSSALMSFGLVSEGWITSST